MVSTLVSTCFGSPHLRHTIKTNIMKLQTVEPEICSILIFQKGPGTSFSNIFCMIFEEKIFSRNILLTDPISLSGCLYFLRYMAI